MIGNEKEVRTTRGVGRPAEHAEAPRNRQALGTSVPQGGRQPVHGPASPSHQAAHTAFYYHTSRCPQCEAVRVDKFRNPSPFNYPRWHANACDTGKELLAAWKQAIDEHLLEHSTVDIGRIA